MMKAAIYQTSSARHLRLSGNKGKYVMGRYPSAEMKITVNDDLHSGCLFIIGSVLAEADSLLELMMLGDALKERTSNVTVIVPYLAYARQDKPERGEPFAAKIVCNILRTAGFRKAYVIDIHNAKLNRFFKFRNAIPAEIFAPEFAVVKKPVVIAPDKGSVERAKAMADILNCELACIEKTRPVSGGKIQMRLAGEVEGKNALIVDDMIDTGGTIIEAAALLKRKGAGQVHVAATHGLFSGNAIKNLEKSHVRKIIVTNTLPIKVSSPNQVVK
jgi:ribose-phosphate pyrophosphokinase